jgi:uridine kinase
MSSRPPPGRAVTVVGICGGSGSGKTTVTRALVDHLGSDCAAVIPHDAYYRDLSHLPPPERARDNVDHPDAFDTGLLAADLAALRAGRPVETPVYDFVSHVRRPERRRVEPRPVIIVEGILILADARLRPLLDIKVFVETAADIRLIRRIRRDTAERGRTLEGVLAQYEATVRPMHLQFVEPSRSHADVVIPEGGENRVGIALLVARLGELARRPD